MTVTISTISLSSTNRIKKNESNGLMEGWMKNDKKKLCSETEQ